MPRNNPRIRFTSTIAPELKEKLQKLAVTSKVPMSQLIDEAVTKIVSNQNTNKKGDLKHMAKTIAICNNKGGVGKTTTSACLADIFGKQGYRVLLIDADPQGNLSGRFGYDPVERGEKQLSSAIQNVLSNKPIATKDFICKTECKNVDIIPADDRLALTKNDLISAAIQFGINAYKTIVSDIANAYDYIIFDTRPTLDEEISQILFAVNWVIIPVNTGRDSIQGASQTIQYQIKCKHGNPSLETAGVFFNRVNNRTASAHDMIPQVQEALYGYTFDTIIPAIEDAVKAENLCLPITARYPHSKVSKAFVKLAEEVQKKIG